MTSKIIFSGKSSSAHALIGNGDGDTFSSHTESFPIHTVQEENTRSSKNELDHVTVTTNHRQSSKNLDTMAHQSSTTIVSSSLFKNSSDHIYTQSKSASVCIDSLIPEAARLILAQTPKNRNNLLDQDRRDTISPDNNIFTELIRSESDSTISPISEAEEDNRDYSPDNEVDDTFDDAPSFDYGLQVIHEETESQMDSDGEDRELDFCHDQESKPGGSVSGSNLAAAFANAWVVKSDMGEHHGSSTDGATSDEIVMKHIRIPSDWDPELLLQRIYTIPKASMKANDKEGSSPNGMEGHMQILSGNRRKGTFWNAWKRKFCVVSDGKLICYEDNEMKQIFESINLVGGKIDSLDPVEFVGEEKGKTLVNRILGVDDGKGHYYVLQCSSVGETHQWIEILQRHVSSSKTIISPVSTTNLSIFRDIVTIEIGTTNIRAGIVTHDPTLPTLFFSSVLSVNEETGVTIYGNNAFSSSTRKKAKIRSPFQCTSKIVQNTLDLGALKGFIQKIFSDLRVSPKEYRLILILPRRIDKRCRQSILELLFYTFEIRGVLICHQSVIAFWANTAENGIVVDVGERCDIVPVTHGFVMNLGWLRAPFGANVMKDFLRQGLAPQEDGLYLSTPVENLVLRFIAENFVYVKSVNTNGARRSSSSQEVSQEIVIEVDLRDILPFSNLIGVNQEVLRGVAEGFFDPGLYGQDCESLQQILFRTILECGVDCRTEMSKNIFLVGGCTLIPGFPERLELELRKICPPFIQPKIHALPYRYHASFIGASKLAGTEAFELSSLKRENYNGGSGPDHWLI